jgi:ESS family glutamate:Na+ symporter
VLPQWDLAAVKATDVERPLLILFFTCIGLNASGAVARQGGRPLVVYLFLAAGIAVMQAVTGVLTAKALGENPLLGLMAGNVSLMGGFGTAAGFAADFEKAGLAGAAALGIAAAALGVIAGGVVAGIGGGRRSPPAPRWRTTRALGRERDLSAKCGSWRARRERRCCTSRCWWSA